MPKSSSLSKRDIERLLAEQTKTILHAVDEGSATHEAGLTVTIEFQLLKRELARVKTVLREKLGVTI